LWKEVCLFLRHRKASQSICQHQVSNWQACHAITHWRKKTAYGKRLHKFARALEKLRSSYDHHRKREAFLLWRHHKGQCCPWPLVWCFTAKQKRFPIVCLAQYAAKQRFIHYMALGGTTRPEYLSSLPAISYQQLQLCRAEAFGVLFSCLLVLEIYKL
jgi:hypothetical protein